MMTNKEIIEVIAAAENGAEIEVANIGRNDWGPSGNCWNFSNYDYRIKPPAKKIVKSLAWRHKHNGEIVWRINPTLRSDDWQRFPCADYEGEVG